MKITFCCRYDEAAEQVSILR